MQKRTYSIIFTQLILIFLILIMPVASAQFGYSYGSSPIERLRQNGLFNFIVFFLIFFAICYFSLDKFFNTNIGVTVIVSLGISYFAAQGLMAYQPDLLSMIGYWWALLILAFFGILYLIKGIRKVGVGIFWVCACFSITWFILKTIVKISVPYAIDSALTNAAIITFVIAVVGMFLKKTIFKSPAEKLKKLESEKVREETEKFKAETAVKKLESQERKRELKKEREDEIRKIARGKRLHNIWKRKGRE